MSNVIVSRPHVRSYILVLYTNSYGDKFTVKADNVTKVTEDFISISCISVTKDRSLDKPFKYTETIYIPLSRLVSAKIKQIPYFKNAG